MLRTLSAEQTTSDELRAEILQLNVLIKMANKSDSARIAELLMEKRAVSKEMRELRTRLESEKARVLELEAVEATQASTLAEQDEQLAEAEADLDDVRKERTLLGAKLMRARREFEAAESARQAYEEELQACRQQVRMCMHMCMCTSMSMLRTCVSMLCMCMPTRRSCRRAHGSKCSASARS